MDRLMQIELGGGNKAESWQEIDLYRFFAALLGSPTRDRFGLLARISSQEVVTDLWGWLGCAPTHPPSTIFKSFEQYEASYIALFDVGAPEPPVPLLESYYHETIPAQQTVLENACYYDVINLRTDPSVSSPDHLLAQLEFAASVRYLQENCNEETTQESLRQMEFDYLQRHLLSWLPAASAKLQKLQPPVFPSLFALMLQFLRNRLDELG
jgi:TorA maturation chaperone TorD